MERGRKRKIRTKAEALEAMNRLIAECNQEIKDWQLLKQKATEQIKKHKFKLYDLGVTLHQIEKLPENASVE